MKRVLGIVASPRRLGNCEMMVKEIARGISIPHQLKLLRLADFDIQPCRACYQCLFGDLRCPVEDHFHLVLEEILAADALILAAPTYFLGANASLKRFLDRGLSFYGHVDRLWGKPSIGVGIAGIEGREGQTLLNIQSFLKLLLTEIRGTRILYGALPGEIFLGEANRRLAASLGGALFDGAVEHHAATCPLCGGDTFRFLGENRVRCMLCSNSGTVNTTAEGPVFRIEKNPHELFLTREDV
ncbi:MAG: flavodoxin family protein [Desulfobacterales bacterium]